MFVHCAVWPASELLDVYKRIWKQTNVDNNSQNTMAVILFQLLIYIYIFSSVIGCFQYKWVVTSPSNAIYWVDDHASLCCEEALLKCDIHILLHKINAATFFLLIKGIIEVSM